MTPRRVLALTLCGILAASSAAAQPKRGRGKPPAAKPSKETPEKAEPPAPEKPPRAEAEKAAKPDAPQPAVEAPVTDELGDAPPAAASGAGAQKLSPLTPEADEFPTAAPPLPPAELDRLLGDISALRSRVAALTTTLFKSRLRVVVETRGEDARLDTLGVTLDDGVVFSAPERFSADDERIVYEHAVAPGQHVLGVDVQRYDVRNREYRTWQSSKFSLLVPENQLVEAHVVIEDDSDMAADFPEDQDGEYDVRVRLRARVTE